MGNEWNDRRNNSNSSNTQNSGTRQSKYDEQRSDMSARDGGRDGGRDSGRDAYRDDSSRDDLSDSGRGLRDPRDRQFASGRGSDYGSAGRSGYGNRDISDFSLGIDRSNQNDRSNGDWFQSPYQSSSQFPSSYPGGKEGWGAGSRGFSQNSNYSSYGATTEPNRETYAGRGPKNYQRSDERIKEDIGHELERHPDIDASQIEVSLQDGVVTLKGHVEDRAQKRMAEDSIEYLPGVKDVRNELVIDQSLFERARDFFMGRSSDDDMKETKAESTGIGMKSNQVTGSKGKRGASKRPM